MKRPANSLRPRARGFALISGLLMLVVVTMLALGMFRSFGAQEQIAGSTREKQRAFSAAQGAAQYAEWWMSRGNWGTGSACSTVTDATVVANMQVCSNALAAPTTLPWAARADYRPPAMTVAAASTPGGLNASNDINYTNPPSLYIAYVGQTPAAAGATVGSMIFQINGAGYGGNATTASVVQSIYGVSPSNIKAVDQ